MYYLLFGIMTADPPLGRSRYVSHSQGAQMMAIRNNSDKTLNIPDTLNKVPVNASVYDAPSSSPHPSTDNSPLPSPRLPLSGPSSSSPSALSPRATGEAAPVQASHAHRKVQISESVIDVAHHDYVDGEGDDDILGVSFSSSADALQGGSVL